MALDISKLTIASAHQHLVKKEFTARELALACLSVIEKDDKEVHAYLEVYDDVLEQAQDADNRIAKGEDVPKLAGIPIAVKDNILIKGRRCTAGSNILKGYVAPYDASVSKKLKDASVVFFGRTNMDEFAMGGSTENSAFGPTKNPHDLSRVPGGSSGGSAAAVAMGSVLAALGSDTGGSIRQPAAFCGLVGLKPTYGSVSRFGLMAMGSSLDQIGPFAKTVEDAQILFEAIAGYDRKDGTSLSGQGRKNRAPGKKVIGVPREFVNTEGLDASVSKNFEHSLTRLREAGYEIRDVSLIDFTYALPAYYIIMPAEVSSNLARYDGVKFGALQEGDDLLGDYLRTRGELFGKEARRRIILGTYVLSAGYYDAYYAKANSVRGIIRRELDAVFSGGVDALAMPTTPSPAFKIGEKSADPLQMYLSDIFTVTANITGTPAISIPSGFAQEGGKELPLGLQLMAAHGREDILFEIGKEFEKMKG